MKKSRFHPPLLRRFNLYRLWVWLLLVMTTAWLNACAVAPALSVAQRPTNWAQAIPTSTKLSARVDLAHELPNFYQVSPILYRSAQPTVLGLAALDQADKTNGGVPWVRTVISLRHNHSDDALYAPSRVHYVQIRFNTFKVREKNVVRFLQTVRNPANQPVLVHCQHGADRTGLMVAVYRVVEQGWSKQQAIAEMTQGGFGFHPVWINLIRYIEQLDVAALKQKVANTAVPIPSKS